MAEQAQARMDVEPEWKIVRASWNAFRMQFHHSNAEGGPCVTANTAFGLANEKALEHLCSRAYRLVRLAGIEPTTPWFVAKYSIQLSYSR